MNLDQQIRCINNPQEFVDICNTVLNSKYQTDFQIIDGARPDGGNDGYIISEKCILAIYCPVKPENKTDKNYREKIAGDLKKAKDLHLNGKLEVKKWTFITTGKLSNDMLIYLKAQAKECGFEGNHLEATFLAEEFYKKGHLLKKFPNLQVLSIDSKLDEINKRLDSLTSTEKNDFLESGQVYIPEKKEFIPKEDTKAVFEILKTEQAEKSKTQLKSIFYKTSDLIAQVNAVLGLLKWYDPVEDKDEDMIGWCDQGIRIAEILNEKTLKAIFLSNRGVFLSGKWSKIDMETVFSIKAGNMIGISIISESQRQQAIEQLSLLEKNFLGSFKEAIDIGLESKDGFILAQICLNIGQAASGRYIHLNALGVRERADAEKALSKKSLISAKDLYTAIGYELGVGYALHNLANQLHTFGDKEEALELNKIVFGIAEKYNDTSLLQTAGWLKVSLDTGKVPDYVHGERRERKK